jgi:hypothetical protein
MGMSRYPLGADLATVGVLLVTHAGAILLGVAIGWRAWRSLRLTYMVN